MDGEADSAPSAETEQNKCVGIAIATFDVQKRTMNPNNQSGWLHNLCSQPVRLVDTDMDSGQINPVLPAKGAPVFHKHRGTSVTAMCKSQ